MTLPFSGLSLPKHGSLLVTLTLDSNYTSTQAGSLAEAILTFKTDGTWAFTVGAGDGSGGSPSSGTWLAAGGVASNYQITYTPGSQAGAPTVVNDAATPTAMSANRAFTVSKNSANASSEVTVLLQRISDTSDSVTATTDLAAEGA